MKQAIGRCLETKFLKAVLWFVRTYKRHGFVRSITAMIPYGILVGISLLYLADAVSILEVLTLLGAYITTSGKLLLEFKRKFRPMDTNTGYLVTTTFGAGLLGSCGFLTLLSYLTNGVDHMALTFPLSWMVTALFITSSLIWFLLCEERIARRALLSVFE